MLPLTVEVVEEEEEEPAAVLDLVLGEAAAEDG